MLRRGRRVSRNDRNQRRLNTRLETLIARERARLTDVWNKRAARLRSTIARRLGLKAGGDWSPQDFADDLGGLADELVNEDAYLEAAAEGRATLRPWEDRPADINAIVGAAVRRVRAYADDVPDRVAINLAQFVADLQAGRVEPPDLADVYAQIDAKMEALASQITRYAEPTWSVGHESYGRQLDEFDVRMAWVLDPESEHCDDCPDLADGGPYSADEIPTWPGAGDTACLDRCRCSIEADSDSWDAAFGVEE